MAKKKAEKMIEEMQTIPTEVTEVVVAQEPQVTVTVTEARPGRPIVQGSARQLKLAAQEARRLAAGGEVRRGRPVVQDSARQQRLAERATKLAQGFEIRPGRPKAGKQESVQQLVQDLVFND
jgi:hypothetical protein